MEQETPLSGGAGALACTEKVLLTPPAVALRMSVTDVVTAETVAVKLAEDDPAGTVTIAGTVTALPLLAMLTLSPPVGAAPFNPTVHESVPAAE